jgi:hypothetical protein
LDLVVAAVVQIVDFGMETELELHSLYSPALDMEREQLEVGIEERQAELISYSDH